MVRVISVHHFSKQEVNTCPAPKACTTAFPNLLILCTNDQFLQVRNLSEGFKLSHSFQTVDVVTSLSHCRTGDYLVSLEGKYPTTSVRVYTNWRNESTDNAPVRPRIASCVGPSDHCDTDNFVDMIEVPQRDSPLQAAVCCSTGNLIVAAKDLLIVYKLIIKTQDHARGGKLKRYLDFQECLHVFHRFTPTELAISEDVIACLSPKEVHVFKVNFSQSALGDSVDDRQQRSISLYSFNSDSEPNNDHRTRSDSEDSSSHQTSLSTKSIELKNITAKRQQDSETSDVGLDGHVGNVKRHKDFICGIENIPMGPPLPEIEAANKENASLSNSIKLLKETLGPSSPPDERATTIKYIGSDPSGHMEADCVTLLHCQLKESEEDREILRNLILEPVFWKEFRVRRNQKKMNSTKPNMNNPLISSYHYHLMSLSACFTSNSEGYLYHLPGHLRKVGKGCGVQKIATYPFTSPVGKIVLEPCFLHAITDTGLETYTLRSGLYTILEAENLDRKTNACPNMDENPICLVGLRPFIGAKRLLVSNGILTLFTSADEGSGSASASDNDWTLYTLKLPSPLGIYKDMMQLANLNRSISPHGYYQLLCEAHILLRTMQRLLSWQSALSTNIEKIDVHEVDEAIHESCWLLALHFLGQHNEQKLTLPFLRMSKKPVLEVLKEGTKMNDEKNEQEVLNPSLLHYVKEIVLHPVSSDSSLDAQVTDMIIELLGKHSIETLAALVVKSTSFKEFKASKMMSYISKHLDSQSSPSPESILAYLLLGLGQGIEEEKLRSVLKQALIIASSFAALLIEQHQLLIEDRDCNISFSELTNLMKQTTPELFVEVLVSIILNKEYSLDVILQLLLDSFAALTSPKQDLSSNSAILQLFLETYFTEVVSDNAPDQLSQVEEQSLQTLVRSYLSSLTVPVRFSEKDLDTDIFCSRMAFLDKLPPFHNSAKEVLDAESPDFWCQNSLLKLQSLLSSPVLALPSCKTIVQDYLKANNNTVVGALSLQVLCSDLSESINLICKHKPSAIIHFAKEKNLKKENWKLILSCLQESLSSHEDSMHEAWYSAMQEVLDHLAQIMHLEVFLQVLPGPESSEEFQGYIQMCRKNQQAADIQELIISTGQKLLSTLTL